MRFYSPIERKRVQPRIRVVVKLSKISKRSVPLEIKFRWTTLYIIYCRSPGVVCKYKVITTWMFFFQFDKSVSFLISFVTLTIYTGKSITFNPLTTILFRLELMLTKSGGEFFELKQLF